MNIFTSKDIDKVLSETNKTNYDWYFNCDINEYIKETFEKDHKYWDELGKQKALNLFKFASERVPAYKDFLKKESINSEKINTFADFKKVPLIDKNNYISKYKIEEMSIDGKLDQNSIIAMSSGTSGNAYLWPRTIYQDLEGAFQHEVMLEKLFSISTKKTLAINLFSMGAYVAGTYTLLCLNYLSQKGYNITSIHPGLNTSDIIKILEKTINNYDQLIVFGYPPFVKDTLEFIGKDFFDKSNVELNFVFASEFFSESFRDYMQDFNPVKNNLYKNSTNIYGAADATLFGYENDATNLFRKLIARKNNIPQNLQIFSDFPTIVEYNPAIRYFELVDNNLILTAMSGVPLIRYDLHDVGGLITAQELKNNLITLDSNEFEKSRIELSNLPYVYITGRKNGDISYYGIIIPKSHFRSALENSDLYKNLSGRFMIEVSDNAHKSSMLILHIEQKSNGILTETEKNNLSEFVNNYLIDNISEFRFLREKMKDKAKCNLRFYIKGQSEIFKTNNIKQKWINQH